MNKIISKIYIVILGLVLILPAGAFAEGQGSYFSATTLSATSITTSTAKLSGSVSFDEGSGTAWFQYGTNYNLDESTGILRYVSKYEGVAQGISKSIGSLKANTTYYYKVCLETNIKGVTCGNTMSFKTKSAPVATTVSTSTSTNSNSNSSTSTATKSTTKTNTTKSTTKTNTTKSDTVDEASQSASVANATTDGNFLPDTFLEWILTITLIFFIVLFGRYLYLKRQEEKEEEEKRQKEALIRGQMA